MQIKLYSFAVLILFFFTEANAQKFNASSIKFGFIAGASGSMFTKSVETFASRTGNPEHGEYKDYYRLSGLIGVTAEYPMSGNFMPSMELIYQASGMSYRQPAAVTIINSSGSRNGYNYFNYNIDYLKLPILANYISTIKSGTRWNFFGGVAPAYNLRSNIVKTGWYNPDNTPHAESTSSGYTLEDVCAFNADLIAGMQIKRTSGVVLGIRTNYSLLPVFKYSSNNDGNLDTRIISGSLTAGFRLK